MNPLANAMGAIIPTKSTSNGMGRLMNIARMVKNGNPEQIAQSLMQQNPQFRQFVEANRGKSPEQVAQEHGFDLSAIMKQI